MERLISDLEKHSGKAGRVSRQGAIVPKYDVLVVCNACGDGHPTRISINLPGPVKKAKHSHRLPRQKSSSPSRYLETGTSLLSKFEKTLSTDRLYADFPGSIV